MPLELVVDSIDAVPEGLREFYVEEDGRHRLKPALADELKGLTTALKTERETAKALKAEQDKLRTDLDKFRDIDPAKYRETLEEMEKLQERIQANNAGLDHNDPKFVKAVDDTVKKRTERMMRDAEEQRKKLEAALAEEKNRNGTLEQQLEEHLIVSQIQKAAAENGVRPTAVQDVVLRGRLRYKIEEGKPIPRDSDGNLIFGPDPSKPETIEEWVSGVLAKEAPHLFEESKGGGVKNLRGGTAGKKRSQMTPQEKSRFITEHGSEAYQELPF